MLFSKSKKNITGLPLTNSQIHQKFINALTKRGQKHISEHVLRNSLTLIKMKELKDLHFLSKAIRHAKPLIQLKNLQQGFRKKLLKPLPINSNRGYKLAIDWIIQGAQKRTERTMSLRLYLELLQAYSKKGYAVKQKETYHNECKLSFFSSKTKDSL